ncbi:MAG: TM2 domain-containing protein [Candidatus Tectomicrobia bacterium]|uniref:TM2 domain-containing protein n=1 Tax=Tectimicrobiota bacterium TaxID=2528274 RepID=A0A932HZ54_UNCTE|nr:TM2 domain-containing protein [Candidatus Tectomicrobia bacterium]
MTGETAPRPRKRKSLFVAFLLWFFLGIVAAHKIYLGRGREGVKLLLAYFFIPLGAAAAAIIVLHAFGVRLVAGPLRPEDLQALARSRPFALLAALVTAVLTVIWIWDFRVLVRQVREHNEAAAREERAGKREEPPRVPAG